MRWRKSLRPMRNDKILQALGLCAKARALIFGTPMVCEALKIKRASVHLVVYASDCSENTEKRLRDRCAFYGAPLVCLPYRGEELAHAIGKSASIAALAVTDAGLCRLLTSALQEENKQEV